MDAHADTHIYSALLLGALQPQVPQRGVSPSQHGPHTQMGWFGELHRSPSTQESRAHQNKHSLCVRPYLYFPLLSTATPPSPPKWSFECVNETKNLAKDRGNSLSCFYSKETPTQVISHGQNGQSKNSLQQSPKSAGLRGVRKSQSFWMTNWSITGTSASKSSTGGSVGAQRTRKHLGTNAFCHGSSTAVPHRHSCSQAPPSQFSIAGQCVHGVLLEAGSDLSWGRCSHEFTGSGNSSASRFTEEEDTTHPSHPNPFARPLQHHLSYQTQI